jgi:hypothetical protein
MQLRPAAGQRKEGENNSPILCLIRKRMSYLPENCGRSCFQINRDRLPKIIHLIIETLFYVCYMKKTAPRTQVQCHRAGGGEASANIHTTYIMLAVSVPPSIPPHQSDFFFS